MQKPGCGIRLLRRTTLTDCSCLSAQWSGGQARVLEVFAWAAAMPALHHSAMRRQRSRTPWRALVCRPCACLSRAGDGQLRRLDDQRGVRRPRVCPASGCVTGTTGRAGPTTRAEKTRVGAPSPRSPSGVAGEGGDAWAGIVLRGLVGVWLVEVELVEVGGGAVVVEVDGGLVAVVVDEASRLSAASVGESIGRRNSQTAVRSGLSPPGSALASLRAMRSVPSALVRSFTTPCSRWLIPGRTIAAQAAAGIGSLGNESTR